MRTARRQGQATVELALGSLVFVTVLLFGIHFAEAGWLSLKVQEAASSALWEATGPRVQRMYPFYDAQPFNQILAAGSGVADTATARYADFDGVGANTGTTQLTLAVTRASGVQVKCAAEPGLNWQGTAHIVASNVYQDQGGLSCNASALFQTVGIPTKFLEGAGGLFQAQHSKPAPMVFCGFGPRVGASCPGAIELLTNDWGLAGATQAADHPDPEINCSGTAMEYCDAARRNFQGNGSAALAFATKYAGLPPTNGTEFNFAFAGVEEPQEYISNVTDHRGYGPYNTGGPGMGFLPLRTATTKFLGK